MMLGVWCLKLNNYTTRFERRDGFFWTHCIATLANHPSQTQLNSLQEQEKSKRVRLEVNCITYLINPTPIGNVPSTDSSPAFSSSSFACVRCVDRSDTSVPAPIKPMPPEGKEPARKISRPSFFSIACAQGNRHMASNQRCYKGE